MPVKFSITELQHVDYFSLDLGQTHPHYIIKSNKCVLGSHRCYYLHLCCVTAEIGDMGPENVYCLHMWQAYVSDLLKETFKMCTLGMPLPVKYHRIRG